MLIAGYPWLPLYLARYSTLLFVPAIRFAETQRRPWFGLTEIVLKTKIETKLRKKWTKNVVTPRLRATFGFCAWSRKL